MGAHNDKQNPTGLETAAEDWKTRSFWMETADYDPSPSLSGDTEADIAIVGGGYTGLHTAIWLKELEPTVDVAIVEGAVCGYGGSGRNGGFAMTMYDRGLADFARDVGDADARAVHIHQEVALDDLERFCENEGIDADIRHTGCFTVSTGAEQDERVRDEIETAERLGLDGFRFLDRDEIRAEIHSDWLRCAVLESSCRLVNPAKLTWGLRDAALRRGVRIYEQTPVTDLHTTGRGVAIDTQGGRVGATRGLVATNSFASALPELRRYLMTFYAYIILTEPLTDEQWERVGWKSRAGVEDRRTFHHYNRPTVDGRILWGGRDAPYFPGEPSARHDRHYPNFGRLEETFREAFPQLDDVRFEYRWGGPIAGTARFLPFVGWADNQHKLAYAAGYTGHGTGPSALMGRTLADLLTDRTSERTELAFVRKQPMRLPPDRVRKPFVNGTSRMLQRADDRSGDGGASVLFDLASRVLR